MTTEPPTKSDVAQSDELPLSPGCAMVIPDWMLAKGDKEALQSKLDYRNLVVIADELTINFDKLPELPVLPPHMQHLPYQHKSSVYHMPKSDALEAEHASHKRDEHVGDAVIRMFIADWIILEHPWIDVGVASTFEQALTSNALFTRLATAYGMKEKLLIHPPPAKIRDREFKKVLADSFEAYFGLLWRQCRKGERPISDFQNYFAKLFSAEVFPDLEKELKRWQEVRDNGKKENIIAKKRKGCKRLLEEGENDIRDHKKRAISPQTLDTSPISASPSTDTFFGIETILLEKQIFELSKSS